MHLYSFEKLQVWQDARVLTVAVYRITKNFPPEEKFGMVSQARRASLSIASNIAEGSSRKSVKDQAHFYQVAYSSSVELLNQLIISADLEFITPEQLYEFRGLIETISNKLNSLRNSILNSGQHPDQLND